MQGARPLQQPQATAAATSTSGREQLVCVVATAKGSARVSPSTLPAVAAATTAAHQSHQRSTAAAAAAAAWGEGTHRRGRSGVRGRHRVCSPRSSAPARRPLLHPR